MEGVDVFVRCWEYDVEHCLKCLMRSGLQTAVGARWHMQSDINLEQILGSSKDFHIASKREAERHAKTPIYVVADDDIVPVVKNFIQSGRSIMERHPEYGILTGFNITDGPTLTPEQQQEEVLEMHAVGGIAFVRRGILTEFPDCEPSKVDHVICDEINRKGLKVGIMPKLRMNHLGCGYSCAIQGYWAV